MPQICRHLHGCPIKREFTFCFKPRETNLPFLQIKQSFKAHCLRIKVCGCRLWNDSPWSLGFSGYSLAMSQNPLPEWEGQLVFELLTSQKGGKGTGWGVCYLCQVTSSEDKAGWILSQFKSSSSVCRGFRSLTWATKTTYSVFTAIFWPLVIDRSTFECLAGAV